jgi:hypothetical protein
VHGRHGQEDSQRRSDAQAQCGLGFSDEAYPEAFKALFLLFVLAVLLESALAILFNRRPFVETFNARAVKPMVSTGFALIFVYMFSLELVSTLARLIRPDVQPPDHTGRILTAMVIAGGSAAVNNLMVGLGFRQPARRRRQPRPNHRPTGVEDLGTQRHRGWGDRRPHLHHGGIAGHRGG